MANFGPYTKNGLTFDFAFHHIAKVQISEPETCTNFLTRRIYLTDNHGQEIIITLFSNNDDFPLEILDEDK